MRILHSLGLTLLLSSFFSTTTQAASFNCLKASTSIEKAVCSDMQLSLADEYMGHLYFAKLASLENVKPFKTFHRNWLKGRQEECPGIEISCLLDSYREYTQRLNEDLPALWRKEGNNQYTWWATVRVNDDLPALIFAVSITVSQDSQDFAALFNGSRAKPANKAFYQDKLYLLNITAIDIYQNFKNIQSIHNIESETFGTARSFAPIEISDFNFDGYADISAAQFVGSVNAPTHYWLYQPNTKQFMYSDALSAISSAEFFMDKNLIKSSWRSSCCHHGEDYYKIVEGVVQKLYQKSFRCEGNGQGCTYTLTQWIKNESVIVINKEGLSDSFDWVSAEVNLN